ncbi:MAG: Flagellar basal body rod protein FlgB [Pseudomonadota bacterium]|jgi:flagellar basal-body rod protein FlgB
MDLLNNALGIHDKALRVRNQRMELLARNIANEDTPHFKSRELDFKTVMAKFEPAEPMAATNQTHFDYGDDKLDDDGMRYRVPFNASADGNTVEITVEQAKYGKAAADYQATLTFLENRVNSIRKALRGD